MLDGAATRRRRPDVCAALYDPVCAVTAAAAGGARRTYGNRCSACADRDVVGYATGACEDDGGEDGDDGGDARYDDDAYYDDDGGGGSGDDGDGDDRATAPYAYGRGR